MEITLEDLKRRLPNPEEIKPTDEYYLTLAKYIDKLWVSMNAIPEIGEEIRKQVVLDLASYYQDIVADAGMWRSFVTMCRKLYGKPVPFYDAGDDYIDFELNLVDVKFMLWYSLESHLGFNGLVSPFDPDISRLAGQVYKLFDFLYEEAPTPENFKPLLELDLSDREQIRDIFKVSGWLFWNSYFMRPTSKHAYEPDINEEDELTLEETLTDEKRLRTTFNRPTGPLALGINDWLNLIIDNKLPKAKQEKKSDKQHRFYAQLHKATGGSDIAFIGSYDELENFLSNKMGWGKSEHGHLPQMRNFSDFVLWGTPDKGLLVAHDIARYIKHPDNPLYDAELSAREAHSMLMQQYVCPPDLLKFLFTHGYVPDAKFPVGKDAGKLLQGDWDFIARMYLHDLYHGD